MPTSRISHRAEGGPDLAYLYASTHHEDGDTNGNAEVATKLNKKQSRSKRAVRRGRKGDGRALRGTTLYLGGEEGPNGKIYCIPGHAERVLCIDTATDEVYPVGLEFHAGNMVNGGKFKWLRGIVVGDIIYGLPCHADCVLRIDTRTDEVATVDIPYEEYFANEIPASGEEQCQQSPAHQERHRPWKYHGGAISPHDGCIYAIPQSARRVLRIDPVEERCSFVGPDFTGRCNWYGGVVGKTDGAIYCIPQNAEGVLRIDASGVVYDGNVEHDDNGLPPSSPEARVLVTTHGEYPRGEHKWHGAAASADGTIVSVPANADTVLCIVPAEEAAYPPSATKSRTAREPELYLLEGETPEDIATGRHRDDGKYKYLGAMGGTDGHVYCFPSGSERVLQIDTGRRVARSVGPNLRDAGMERLFQNKWQNGLAHYGEGCVYAIPLAAETVLRIRTGPPGEGPDKGGSGRDDEGNDQDLREPEVTTWRLPEPNDTLEKWEGGVIAGNGVMYCMPNNHKAVLQIVPPCVPSREALHSARDEREEGREREREAREGRLRREAERRREEKEKKRQERLERKRDERRNGEEGAGPSAREEEKKGEDEADKRKEISAQVQAAEPILNGGEAATEREEGKGQQRLERTRNEKNNGRREAEPLAREDGMKDEDAMDQSRVASKQAQTAKSIVNNDEATPDGIRYEYRTGIPTLRSSTHRVKYSTNHRRHDPDPRGSDGASTGTTFLPRELCDEHVLAYSMDKYNFHDTVVDMLRSCNEELVGAFRPPADGAAAPTLENFLIPPKSLTRKCQKGRSERAQKDLTDVVASDAQFLSLFDSFLEGEVLPHLKERLQAVGVCKHDELVAFYYQRPPTLRIQPGPARALVRAHDDAEYGHQNGELNFWMPLTSRRRTGVDLWCESRPGVGDYRRLKAEVGEAVSFHGSSRRHYVNPNHSPWTRVSLDFRVGVEGFFDPHWQMVGTTDDHGRRKVTV